MSIQSFINSPFNKPAPIPAPVVYSLVDLHTPGVAAQVPQNVGADILDYDLIRDATGVNTLTLVVPAGTYNLEMVACFSPSSNDQILSYGQILLYDTVANVVLAESQGYSGACATSNVDAFWIFNHEQLIKFTTQKTVSLTFNYAENLQVLDIRTGNIPTPQLGVTGAVNYTPRITFTKVPDEPTVIIPTF
jgi:hypothetical protein